MSYITVKKTWQGWIAIPCDAPYAIAIDDDKGEVVRAAQEWAEDCGYAEIRVQ